MYPLPHVHPCTFTPARPCLWCSHFSSTSWPEGQPLTTAQESHLKPLLHKTMLTDLPVGKIFPSPLPFKTAPLHAYNATTGLFASHTHNLNHTNQPIGKLSLGIVFLQLVVPPLSYCCGFKWEEWHWCNYGRCMEVCATCSDSLSVPSVLMGLNVRCSIFVF